MTQQATVEQQLRAQVLQLKERILDTQDTAQQLRAQNQELTGALTKIVELVGVPADEAGQVQILALINAVENLVGPSEEEK